MSDRTKFMLWGVVLWLAGVVLIRLLGSWFFDAGPRHVAWFGLNFGFGALTILALAKVTNRSRHAMLVPSVVVAMVAMLMDGLAITLDTAGLTHIYADTAEHAAYAGGTLLFAFWSALFFALLWHREPT